MVSFRSWQQRLRMTHLWVFKFKGQSHRRVKNLFGRMCLQTEFYRHVQLVSFWDLFQFPCETNFIIPKCCGPLLVCEGTAGRPREVIYNKYIQGFQGRNCCFLGGFSCDDDSEWCLIFGFGWVNNSFCFIFSCFLFFFWKFSLLQHVVSIYISLLRPDWCHQCHINLFLPVYIQEVPLLPSKLASLCSFSSDFIRV